MIGYRGPMRLALVVLLLSTSSAFAQSEPAAVGTWAASMAGFEMVLTIGADGSCTFDQERGRCSAKGGKLVWSGSEGSETYAYSLSGDTMTISGGDLEMAIAFQRKGGRAPAEAAAPPAPSGPGTPFSKGGWGVSFVAPAGWKLGEKDGIVYGGHDSEAGLLIIRYLPRTTREQIVAEYQKGVNEQGVTAMPTSEAKPWKGGKASGVAGELAGSTSVGQSIKIRSIAVLASHGGALVVAGLTTADSYANLKARVEQLASTVVMVKPKEVAGGALAGAYAFIYVSKSGSYSRESYLTLCRSGRFTRRGELAGSGDQGSATTANRNAGTWKAEGGALILEFGDGTSAQVPYKVSDDPKDRSGYGAGVWFGTDLYQKSGAGDC